MLIDSHTHCFPDALAPRAIAALTATAIAHGFTPMTDGTAASAEAALRAAGIDRGVVCNIATNAHQQQKVNDFAIATNARGGMLTALGSIHPDSDCIEAELDRLCAAGIRGIKIHPDYVGIDLSTRGSPLSLTERRHAGCLSSPMPALTPSRPDTSMPPLLCCAASLTIILP